MKSHVCSMCGGGAFWLAASLAVSGCAADHSSQSNWQDRAQQAAQTRLTTTDASARATGTDRANPFVGAPVFRLAAYSPDEKPAETGGAQSMPAEEPAEVTQTKSTKTVERGPLPTFAETVRRDLKEMPHVLWHDSKAAFGNPYNLLLLGAAGGASIALRTTNADYHIAEHYERHHTFRGDWPDTFGALGNPATHFALAGVWYLTGQQFQDDKTYEVGRKMFNALTITGMTTMFLKVCAWDYSPNGEWGAWPSGHVSSSMAIATVLNDAYGPLVGAPMYGITALVGIERLDDGEHYFSDVVFGAALGWVVAETVMKEHRPEIFGGEVVPYVNLDGGAGIAWLKNLGNDKPKTPAPQ